MLRLPISTVKRHNLELVQGSHIKKDEDKQTKAYHFEIISYEEYSQLQISIATVLDNIYKGLEAQEPIPAQTDNEPMKTKPAKPLATTAQ